MPKGYKNYEEPEEWLFAVLMDSFKAYCAFSGETWSGAFTAIQENLQADVDETLVGTLRQRQHRGIRPKFLLFTNGTEDAAKMILDIASQEAEDEGGDFKRGVSIAVGTMLCAGSVIHGYELLVKEWREADGFPYLRDGLLAAMRAILDVNGPDAVDLAEFYVLQYV